MLTERWLRRSGVGALCWMVAVAMVAASGDDEAPCTNFGRVDAAIYRGAEPDSDCLDHLARLGVRTVVNLRDEKDASTREEAAVRALGMRYVSVPMSGFARPPLETVEELLAMIAAPRNQPVFVHCKRGRDRTGVVVAAYRIRQERWAAEKAMQEAEDYGLAWWQVRMKRFIRSLAGEAARNGGQARDGG